jgi:DnaJ-class molecular chaperone
MVSPLGSLNWQSEITVEPDVANNGGQLTLKLEDGRQVRVKIPAGIKEGSRLRLKGLRGRSGDRAGDLYVDIHISKDF